MTVIHHPATMPVASVGLVDRSAYRVGSALVRWSTRRAEPATRRTAAGTAHRVTVETAPALRHAVLVERRGRELAAVRAEATLLFRH